MQQSNQVHLAAPQTSVPSAASHQGSAGVAVSAPLGVDAPQFTESQLNAYAAYERVRKGGRFNMFDPRARRATKLDIETYRYVIRNFVALRAAYEASKGASA